MQRLLMQFETGPFPEDPRADDERWTASVDSIGPRIDTHWSRTLFYDLFNAEGNDHFQGADRPAPQ